MSDPDPGRARPTIGISTFVPSLATTVEVTTAADHASLDAAWTGEFNDRSAIVARGPGEQSRDCGKTSRATDANSGGTGTRLQEVQHEQYSNTHC